MLAASPALFPSVASAKPWQNNPAPVSEEEDGKERESKGRPGRGELQESRAPDLQGNIRLLRYASVPFFFPTSPGPDCVKQDGFSPASPKQPQFEVTQTSPNANVVL